MISTRADADTHIETPEGIELVMPLADPIARAYAFAIDLLLRFCLVIALSLILRLLFDAQTAQGIHLISFFVIMWGYYVVFEMWWDGQSPGKRSMKLRVVNDDFTPINLSTSVIRNLLRTADMLPVGYAFGILTMLFNPKNQRLGDIAARTVVVSTVRPVYQRIEVAETALPPDVVLTPEEQRHIIDFARFYEVNSTARAHEIAYNLSQTFNEGDVHQLATRLRRYAKWFLGER